MAHEHRVLVKTCTFHIVGLQILNVYALPSPHTMAIWLRLARNWSILHATRDSVCDTARLCTIRQDGRVIGRSEYTLVDLMHSLCHCAESAEHPATRIIVTSRAPSGAVTFAFTLLVSTTRNGYMPE